MAEDTKEKDASHPEGYGQPEKVVGSWPMVEEAAGEVRIKLLPREVDAASLANKQTIRVNGRRYELSSDKEVTVDARFLDYLDNEGIAYEVTASADEVKKEQDEANAQRQAASKDRQRVRETRDERAPVKTEARKDQLDKPGQKNVNAELAAKEQANRERQVAKQEVEARAAAEVERDSSRLDQARVQRIRDKAAQGRVDTSTALSRDK